MGAGDGEAMESVTGVKSSRSMRGELEGGANDIPTGGGFCDVIGQLVSQLLTISSWTYILNEDLQSALWRNLEIGRLTDLLAALRDSQEVLLVLPS